MTRVGRTGTHAIASGPAKGLLINVAGSRPSYVLGTAEEDIQAFLAEHIKPGDVVLDLGANVGFLTLVAAALTGPHGRVIAFEPFPTIAAALRANIAANDLPSVEIIEAAVTDEVARRDLHFNGSSQDASLVTAPGPESVSVDTVTVDSEMERLGLRPNVIKIDVEGAEEAAIRGMRQTLELARPIIVCEVHVGIAQLDDPVPAMLRASGYQVSWLEPGIENGSHFWAPHLVAIPAPTSR